MLHSNHVILLVIYKQQELRILEVGQDHSNSCVNSRVYSGLAPGVIVDQCEALAVTTGLTDMVYFVSPI